jgi:all-trans-retinol 13,14-reductase
VPARDAAYDDLVIGSGMAGLTVGALLARAGRRVLMLEAHDTPGGYAHTFAMGRYRFCAQVHYIFGCGEGEPVNDLLTRLDLADQVTFHRLDPEGFDHVVVAGDRYRIPNGLAKFRDRLIRRHPDAARPLRRYFAAVMATFDQLERLPDAIGLRELALAPLRFPRLLRYQSWTLQRYFDHVGMPRRLQAVLAGQAGDYLLPPAEVSFLLHVSLVANYDRGAYYPDKHFSHLVESVADTIRNAPGCALLLDHEVTAIELDGDRAARVRTRDGSVFRAGRFVSNIDPAMTARLVGAEHLPADYRRTLDYSYSSGNITLYLGVKGLDLGQHGFGAHNVWHYPHDDLNRMYRVQGEGRDLDDPWLFLSTPTLHSSAPGLAPPGHQILEVATSCDYRHFAELRATDRKAYTRAKVKVRDRILEILDTTYVPGLRKHLAMKVAGTPLTNERYCRAPFGNAYGSALVPANMRPRVAFTTPIRNLFMVNASAGFPSVGGTVSSGLRLYDQLARG